TLDISGLWLDGFAELSTAELDLLAALIPHCAQATLAFCLDQEPTGQESWLSSWSMVRRTCRECRQRLEGTARGVVEVEVLGRRADRGRFVGNEVLSHLERHWAEPELFREKADGVSAGRRISDALRLASCTDLETEARLAAREVVQHVQAGGRYREVSVL